MKTTRKSLNLKSRLRDADEEERQALIEGLPHKVGFAKPPKSTRFKPGQSGNPKGRSKDSGNLGKILAEELAQKIEVNEGGRRRKLPKGRVAVRQVANKAAAGDVKAFNTVTELLRKTGQLDGAPMPREQVLSADDMQAAADVVRFYVCADQTEADDEAGAA